MVADLLTDVAPSIAHHLEGLSKDRIEGFSQSVLNATVHGDHESGDVRESKFRVVRMLGSFLQQMFIFESLCHFL